MHTCNHCGSHLQRIHRKWYERPLIAAAYVCVECGGQQRQSRLNWRRFSLVSACPRCGNTRLRTFRKRDHIEGFRGGPFRLVQKWLGARLHYCDRCRLQFYDLRRTAPSSRHS